MGWGWGWMGGFGRGLRGTGGFQGLLSIRRKSSVEFLHDLDDCADGFIAVCIASSTRLSSSHFRGLVVATSVARYLHFLDSPVSPCLGSRPLRISRSIVKASRQRAVTIPSQSA